MMQCVSCQESFETLLYTAVDTYFLDVNKSVIHPHLKEKPKAKKSKVNNLMFCQNADCEDKKQFKKSDGVFENGFIFCSNTCASKFNPFRKGNL